MGIGGEKMTEAEWLRQIKYLYTPKQYRNRILLLILPNLAFVAISVVGFALGANINDECFVPLAFGMGFGGFIMFVAFNIITMTIPHKMNIYRYYKKNPSELNDKMNLDLLAKAKCRVGYEDKKAESIGNVVITTIGRTGIHPIGTKKWRIWKTYQQMKEEKRKKDYRKWD